MSTFAYKLSFPCPECGGVLTMSVKSGEGNCPLCHAAISVNLDVKKTNIDQGEAKRSGLGWDRRAFRRPSTSVKPMWQPLHQPSE